MRSRWIPLLGLLLVACAPRTGTLPKVTRPESLPPLPARPDERLAEAGGRHERRTDARDDAPPSDAAARVEPENEAKHAYLTMDDPPRCPPEMALVGDACVDKWESVVVRVLPGGVEEQWSPFKPLDGVQTPYRAVSKPGVAPQGYISGVQAQAACRLSGKRLCTPAEWEAACRGPRGTTYPYGQSRKKHTCNDDGRPEHPVAEVARRIGLPPERMWYEGMAHPLLNQLDNTLRKTGRRDECTNEYGAYDMVGNLHEWIDDPAGTFRGGFYLDTRINGEGCDYATTAHSFKYHDYSTGFRCCLDADGVE